MAGTEKRRFDRIRGRIPCTIRSGDEEHRGFATDLSASGLFLQSRTKFEAGQKLTVELEHDGASPIVLTATVARTRVSHRSAMVVAPPGLGLLLESAPEAYFQLILAGSRS